MTGQTVTRWGADWQPAKKPATASAVKYLYAEISASFRIKPGSHTAPRTHRPKPVGMFMDHRAGRRPAAVPTPHRSGLS